jgi:hypothetical protein
MIISMLLHGPSLSYAKEEIVMSTLSPRLHALFSKTKLLCFGRYALEVPAEAELTFGRLDVEVFGGGLHARKKRIESDIQRIRSANRTAEIVYSDLGPVDGSWQIRYYRNDTAKESGTQMFSTYVSKGDLTFVIRDAAEEKIDVVKTSARQKLDALSLRVRKTEESPQTPGLCIEQGFMEESGYNQQETFSAGVHLPSIADFTFSVSSNKDAYADYTPADRASVKLSLLARIEEAKEQQGRNYPRRTVLREGKRKIQHWYGEESLIKRADGTHDFEWGFVGTPKDVANPSELNAVMFTKVAHNTVGAAPAASLSDEEAVALFDKLLSGLKFRVRVPNAPPGSYYYPSENSALK